MSKQISTISGVKAMNLPLKGTAPAFSNKCITKGELNQWYYVDNVAAGISTYPDNRVLSYENIIGATFVKPAAQFYQYDVTRSSIPNATGGFFTYTSTDFTTQTILQNSYGYVGRFCMQEGSFSNNQHNLYTISLVGLCYPSYGAYPQPYLSNCNLYFNNLGSYTIEDVKVYQLVTVENSQTNAALILGSASGVSQGTLAALGVVPGINMIWATVSFLAIAGGAVYGQGNHLTNSLRYTGTGAYTNGSVSFSDISVPTGTTQFYVAYKVKNPQGYYPIVFGYGQYEDDPPGLTSTCSGSQNTAAVWTSQDYTTCVSCSSYTVYKDTNIFSTSFNKYKVNDVIGTTTAPASGACNTTATWTYVYQNCASCVTRDIYKDTNECSATYNKYKINTDGAVQTDAPTNTGACNTAQTWTDNGTTICIACTNVTVYKNTNPCSTNHNFYRYTNPTTSAVVTQESDPSTAACVTSANWVFQYYNCSGCTTRDVERDMNPCSSTYLGYTVDHGVHVGTTAPTDTGACNTSQVWTDTGVTRCNDCVNEKEQEQTNSCATGHTTKRWVAGGSACSTAQNWVNSGSYSCYGTCNKYNIEVQNNPCASGHNTTRQGSLVESNSTFCGGCCGQSTTANWTVVFGQYECDGCNKYYVEQDLNNCSPTANQTRRGGLAEANSSFCCTATPTCYTLSSQLITYDSNGSCYGQYDTVEQVTLTLRDQYGNAIAAPTNMTFTYSTDYSSYDDYNGFNSGTSTGFTMTIYAGSTQATTTLSQYTHQVCPYSNTCDCWTAETNFTVTAGPYPQCP